MTKTPMMIFGLAAALALTAQPAESRDRYAQQPPVVVSPDLSAPWVMQLGRQPGRVVQRQAAPVQQRAYAQPQYRQQKYRQPWPTQPDVIRTSAVTAAPKKVARPQIDPIYLPQTVNYDGGQKPGTIVIDTVQNFLYLVESGGKARRYGVGTGKPGFEWAGTHKISQKREWPDWRPPAEMIAREKAKGRFLPTYLAGGPENPLGARAMYLGSTLYRIHGTNQPWTIGNAVSSGCIRMRNEDVVDLYERVGVGTTVVVM